MAVEQQIKERTIRYQQIFLMITIGALALVSGVLLYVFFQKRRLNTAYKTLFEKNLKIIELQERPTETHRETDKKNTLTDNVQRELLDKIVAIMEDTAVICHPDFSLDKLAELVQSNQKYVSQTVNTVLKINFRSFLNGYRIREAQQLFAELDTTKFTIESVALKVGFKSPSAFRTSFKEVTGVSPSFYLKSIQTRNQAD